MFGGAVTAFYLRCKNTDVGGGEIIRPPSRLANAANRNSFVNRVHDRRAGCTWNQMFSRTAGDHVAVTSSLPAESCSNHAWNSRRRSRDTRGAARIRSERVRLGRRLAAGAAKSQARFARVTTGPAVRTPNRARFACIVTLAISSNAACGTAACAIDNTGCHAARRRAGDRARSRPSAHEGT